MNRKKAVGHPPLRVGAIVFSAILVGISCLLGIVGVGGAAVALPAPPWPAQVDHPASTVCPEGEPLIAPTSGTTDALGVSHISYQAAPGLVVNLPPRGLSASKVTKAILDDLKMSVAPQTLPGERSMMIRQVVDQAKRPTAPAFCESRPISQWASGHVVLSGHYYGPWAGYAVTEAENGGGINTALGQFIVGSDQTNPSDPSVEATWVGIGGDIGGETQGWGLIQAGVQIDSVNGERSVTEFIGNSCSSGPCLPQYNNTVHPSPGDLILAEVTWVSSTEACMEATDEYNSPASTGNVCVRNPPIVYDHTSAEWIDEWPDAFKVDYANPGTTNWSDQSLSGSFNGGSPWKSPFTDPYQAEVSNWESTRYTSCTTSTGAQSGVLAYPTAPGGSSTSGTSEIITCSNTPWDPS